MTNKELKQLSYLKSEIKAVELHIEELESIAESTTAHLSSAGGSGSPSDKVAKYAAEIADCQNRLRDLRTQCLAEAIRLEQYINSIDDSFIRQIITYRHICGYGWGKIARMIGGGNQGNTVRMAYFRYINKHKK